MTLGTGNRAEINVTPLIDVLLVLLIIFLVITPSASHGINARIPSPAPEDSASAPIQDIVVAIDANRAITINTEAVSWQELGDRFMKIFARRADKILFVTAAPRLDFDDVARVIDTARGVGVERIALMPRVDASPGRVGSRMK